MIGGSVSTSVKICGTTADSLEQKSLALQLRVMTYLHGSLVLGTSLLMSSGFESHESKACAVPTRGEPGEVAPCAGAQVSVAGEGTKVTVGFTVSTMLKVVEAVAVFPHPSVANHTRVMMAEQGPNRVNVSVGTAFAISVQNGSVVSTVE